jgi:hemoglobin
MSESDVTADAASVERGVALFVARLVDDPLLCWTFEGVDQALMQRHSVAFVVAALGGPDPYLGRDLRTVHERFRLDNTHFDTAVIHLIESLREVGISDGVLADLAIRLEPLRSLIVAA